jgi:hypothetical protein
VDAFKEIEIEELGRMTCAKMEPVDAYLLLGKIGKVVIPVIVASKGIAQGVKGAPSAADMMPAVRALFEQLTPELQLAVQLDLFKTCAIIKTDEKGDPYKQELNGVKAINNAFRGHSIKCMFKAMSFALEVNFGDFFAGKDGIANVIQMLSR